ncbi:prostatic acid phosphatase-like isoform X1 [Rhodnius prolixus]|uniref:acid phosphatase n=1 Tax=Rhodnius prolixus TaxID=13249 RepID=A0A4P6D6F9_RHOPR
MQRYGLPIVIAFVSAALIYLIFAPSKPYYTVHADDTLVRAVIFFRHGDRGPVSTYPNDPHPFTDRKKWPHGTDGLTKKGKQDSYALGKVLRNRYKNFLPDAYYPDDIIAYSTGKERTHATAALVLAGLYPPTAEEKWSDELSWHPIPIYGDIIFNNTNGLGCPRFREESLNVFAAFNETFFKEHGQTLSYLSHHTGLDLFKDPYPSVIKIGDCLIMQSRSGFELPDWSKEVFPDKIISILKEIYNKYALGSEVHLQLGGGLMIQRVLDIFKNGKRKLYLHSTHDLLLMLLEGALGVPGPIPIPQPTAAVLIELHNVSGSRIVKAFLLQHSGCKHFEPLQMNCGLHECLLEEFEAMTSNLTVQDYYKLCNEISNQLKEPDPVVRSVGATPVPYY